MLVLADETEHHAEAEKPPEYVFKNIQLFFHCRYFAFEKVFYFIQFYHPFLKSNMIIAHISALIKKVLQHCNGDEKNDIKEKVGIYTGINFC